MLVKRPLLVGDGFVLVGFREEEWKAQKIFDGSLEANTIITNLTADEIQKCPIEVFLRKKTDPALARSRGCSVFHFATTP